jgi:hypothetical protein
MSTRILRSALVVLTVALATACGGGNSSNNGGGSGLFGGGSGQTGGSGGGSGGTGTGGRGVSGCVQLARCVGQCPTGTSAQSCLDACGNAASTTDQQLFINLAQCAQTNSCQDSSCVDALCASQLQACENG